MKAVILAGGLGTRLAEETEFKPKPMVEIGGKPILWHIMKTYMAHGIADFIICLGYKGYMIKEYFANYSIHMSDIEIDPHEGGIKILQNYSEPWRVTLINTGENTMTGGRLKRVSEYLEEDDFCFTYGDGLSSVNLTELIAFHRSHGRLATLTAVQPPGRFGSVSVDGNRITGFVEKPEGDGGWINGGFFVLNRRVIDLISGDATIWEREPLQALAANDELRAFFHKGFWQPMDTLRDKVNLEGLWNGKAAPWKIW